MDQDKINKIKNIVSIFFGKKRYWISAIIIVIIALSFLLKDPSKGVVVATVENKSITQTVLATGQVTSNVDLGLSFNSSGNVSSVKVKVGDQVKKGGIIATLEQGSVGAALTSARGAVAAAEARYKKIIDGSSNEEIAIAQINLENTKATQDVLVKNALNNLLSSYPEAIPVDFSKDYIAPVISGNYILGKEGTINLKVYNSSNGKSFDASGLTTGFGPLNDDVAQPIGNSGLYIKLPTSGTVESTDWKIEIPNKKASNYLVNYNAYQSALQAKSATVSSAEAELALKKAIARPADVALAEADILQARGTLEQAQANYENTIIRAPADGTITSVDIKVGELASTSKQVVMLQDVSNLYIKTKINESNIASVVVGQSVIISFDAFAGEFTGSVVQVDPAAKIEDGIVNYEIKISINEKSDVIRPGMNADVKINAGGKDNVLVVSKAGVKKDETGSYVDMVTNKKSKKSVKQSVTTGVLGDGGLIEIQSGLSVNDEIILSRP
ncbi:MAG: efflux RND transporter periplasmic adaptor subunit [Candidatus Paceibacterota bacterium]